MIDEKRLQEMHEALVRTPYFTKTNDVARELYDELRTMLREAFDELAEANLAAATYAEDVATDSRLRDLRAELATVKSERDELRKYASHHRLCDSNLRRNAKCNCGFPGLDTEGADNES